MSDVRSVREYIFGKSASSFDALSLALARTKSDRFTSSSDSWNKLIFSLQKELQNEGQSLLDDFQFDRFNRTNPRSQQTNQFLTHLRTSEAVVLWTKVGEMGEYEMPKNAKQSIIEGQGPLFEKNEGTISKITFAIDENLGIHA